MEETSVVDRQGRVVIPSRIRESLGLKSGGDIVMHVDGYRLIIERRSRDVEKKITEWVNVAKNMQARPFAEREKVSWKWMSDEYARRKLGL